MHAEPEQVRMRMGETGDVELTGCRPPRCCLKTTPRLRNGLHAQAQRAPTTTSPLQQSQTKEAISPARGQIIARMSAMARVPRATRADPRPAHSSRTHDTETTRATTRDRIRGTNSGRRMTVLAWDPLRPPTTVSVRRRKAITDARRLRSSRVPHLRLRRREMRTIAKRCGGYLAPWTRTVSDGSLCSIPEADDYDRQW
jgi:hypothetical protein